MIFTGRYEDLPDCIKETLRFRALEMERGTKRRVEVEVDENLLYVYFKVLPDLNTVKVKLCLCGEENVT